jgi:hypothetical protein
LRRRDLLKWLGATALVPALPTFLKATPLPVPVVDDERAAFLKEFGQMVIEAYEEAFPPTDWRLHRYAESLPSPILIATRRHTT